MIQVARKKAHAYVAKMSKKDKEKTEVTVFNESMGFTYLKDQCRKQSVTAGRSKKIYIERLNKRLKNS